jgi:transcriptional regulator with XRE-family HTH domain
MSFKENLKSELLYKAMMVKELAALTGIKRHTLDNYLNTHNSVPNAETAVKIARALGVTVEYLVTGKEHYDETKQTSFPPDLRLMVEIGSRLNRKSRKLALGLLKTLEEHDRAPAAF